MGDDAEKSSTKRRALPRPSASYQEARESGVNRLSELMFGSLLASYVLGFIAFLALLPPPLNGGAVPVPPRLPIAAATPTPAPAPTPTQAPPVDPATASRPPASHDPDHRPSPAYVQLGYFLPFSFYLLISLSFTYLTVGMYVAYHIGILTMPHPPLGRLSVDFVVSLLPAFSFGLAMLVPRAYLSLVAIVWAAVTFRQLFESRKLEQFVEVNILPPDPALPDPEPDSDDSNPRESDAKRRAKARHEERRKKARIHHIRRLIAKHDALSGWGPPDRRSWIALAALIPVAAIADSGQLYRLLAGGLVHTILVYLCAALICFFGHRALRKRSALLSGLTTTRPRPPEKTADGGARPQPRNPMDDAAATLEAELHRGMPVQVT